MEIKKFMSLSYKNAFSVKKIPFILIITFILTLLFIGVAFNHTLFNYIYKICNNNYENRTFIVQGKLSQEEKTEILKIDNVVSVNDFSVAYFSVNTDEYEEILLYPLEEKALPKTIKGKRTLGNGKIICPKNFVPKKQISSNYSITTDEIINANKLLGKSFIAILERKGFDGNIIKTYDTLKKELTFGATYDSEKYMMNNNACFISYDDFNEIFTFFYPSDDNMIIIKDTAVLVDNFNNLNSVKEKIEIKDYEVYNFSSLDYKLVSTIVTISIIVLLLFLLIIYITIHFNIKREISAREKEIFLYKYIGYTQEQIKKLFLLENIGLFIISSLCACILGSIGGLILKSYTNKLLLFRLLEIKFGFVEIIIVMLIGVVYSTLVIKSKIKKCMKKEYIRL